MVVAEPRVSSPVTTYAHEVLSGEIVAGPWVRLACERHLRDLELGPLRGLRFSDERANHAIRFFHEFLMLSEGEHAGRPFILQPWQQFIIGSLFGWLGPDGYRRFRKFYGEIGKGAGKSPLAAGIGLYGLVADGEAGAEIYAAAVTRDQAGIMFTDAQHMVAASPHLSSRVDIGAHNLAMLSTNSYFRPVSSEARSLDGKRVHMALIDEIHEHRTPMVVQKMQAGTKGRRQPLIVEITNSGWDQTSICWQHHEYSTRVLEQVLEDDGWFAYVCALDKDDDWRDPAVWVKGNPNLGISVTHKYLEEQVREAQNMPAQQNIVKRLNFCIWTEQIERWLDMARWDACDAEPQIAPGQACYLGLDLSSTTDITAAVAVFPADDGYYDLRCHFWMPEVGIREREQRDGAPYRAWMQQGYISATEGDIVDYDVIRETVKSLAETYEITEIPYDPWNATQLATQLGWDGATVVPMSQGYASLSEASKFLESLILTGRLRHGGHPVLRWMAANVAVKQGPNDSIRPVKGGLNTRIDGIVALVMGLGRVIAHMEPHDSVYEARGVFRL
jgi:phage terminase large subunit-like protein